VRHASRIVLTLTALAVTTAPAALAANGDCRLIRGAATPDPADDVSICRQDTWFHQATTKVGNGVAADGASPSWNTTKPTASVTSGAGGGYFTNSLTHQPTVPEDLRATALFEGTYTGTLDNLAIELYGFTSPVYTSELNILLEVDTWTLYNASMEVRAEPGGDQVQKFKFALTNVYAALEGFQAAGGPDTTHTIRLAVNGRYVVNDPTLFVYDTSETPSGIIFNLETAGLNAYTKIDVGG
jgi:hypothetical protein